MVEHHIKKDILNRLTYADCLRFSELKPDGLENNIFMYHLKQLIRDGYVTKADDGYKLDHLGLQYVDRISSTNLRPRTQPKIIAILALQGPDDRWLLVERKQQPYLGQRMFLSGKQHFGETIHEHARRELQDKIGRDISLQYKGIAEVIITQDSKILTQVLAHIHYGRLPDASLPPDTSKFRFVWHDFTTDDEPLMAGTWQIMENIRDSGKSPFMLDINAPA